MSRVGEALAGLDALELRASADGSAQALDARAKVGVTLLFTVAVASFPAGAVSPLLPFVAFPAALAAAGRVPFREVARRLLLALPFVLLVALPAPFLDRTPLPGALPGVTAGWATFVSVLLRFALTASAALALVATTGLIGVAAALGALGVPRPLVTQVVLLSRSLSVLGAEAERMERARDLRSSGRRGRELKRAGSFLGTLLLRSWERAERIHRALLARGFTGSFPAPRPGRMGGREALFVLGWCGAFVLFRLADVPSLLGRLLVGGLG